jgi:hypothetical protein
LAGWNAPVDDGGAFVCRRLNVSWKNVMSVGTDTDAYPRPIRHRMAKPLALLAFATNGGKPRRCANLEKM